MLKQTPVGLDEIIATFGKIDNKTFEATNIVNFALPYPLVYDGKEVVRARCHKLLVENFQQAFEVIKAAGLQKQATRYGGIYARRSIRGFSSHVSTHSWGIAIDLEPQSYPLGSRKRMPDEIIKAFENAGFFYGGNFKKRPDPMHFQFATKY